jgi:hypothetical protein
MKDHKFYKEYVETFFHYDLDESINAFLEELRNLEPFERLFKLIKMKYGYSMHQAQNKIMVSNHYNIHNDTFQHDYSEKELQDYRLYADHRKVNTTIEIELITIHKVLSALLESSFDIMDKNFVKSSLFLFSFENWKLKILSALSGIKEKELSSNIKILKYLINDLKYKLDYSSVFFIGAVNGKVIPELFNESFTEIDKYLDWLENLKLADIKNYSKDSQKIVFSPKASKKRFLKIFPIFFELIKIQLNPIQFETMNKTIFRIISLEENLDSEFNSIEIDFIPKEKVYDFVKIFLYLGDQGYIESNKTRMLEVISSNFQSKNINNGFSLSNLKRIKGNEHDQFSINGLKQALNSSILYNFK